LALLLLMLSAALQFSSIAQAQTEGCQLDTWAEFDYRTAFESMAATTCFAAENNDSPLGLEVNSLLSAPTPDARARALLALQAVQQFLQNSFDDSDAPQTRNAGSLNNAIKALKQSIVDNPQAPEAGLKSKWQLGQLEMLPEALEGLDFTGTLQGSNCALVSSGMCDSEFAVASDIIRSIFLVNAALDEYSANYRAEALEDRRLRRSKWDSYYDDLTFQYPWELWANSLLLEATDKRSEIDGNLIGFRKLPRNKLVLLHPEANLAYADEASNEYDITITMEMLGYESFGFDRSGKVDDAWGVSLLAAYLPHPDRDEYGWSGGLLLKYDGYSLGITDNHGETGVVFNINLSQRIFDVKKQARRYYDEYQSRFEAVKQGLQ
jgi:hypothetical protein